MGMFNRKDAMARPQVPRDGSFLMAGCALEGKFNFKGAVIVSATLKGDVVCDSVLIIEPGGRIEGTVSAAEIIVQGTLSGSIAAARSIEVWTGANLSGDVFAPSLKIDEGARVNADLLIAAERPQAHINRAPAIAAAAPVQAAPGSVPLIQPPSPPQPAVPPLPSTLAPMFAKAAG